MYEGAIIKETITDELLFDYVNIEKVEIWKTGDEIKYWTMVFFTSDQSDFPKKLSEVILENWFADMKQGNVKYIVFRGCVYSYTIGNVAEKEAVLNKLRGRGIPEHQFDWAE